MLVVVNNFLNFRNLNLVSVDFKYQPQRMLQIHRILALTIANERMASPDSKLNKHLDRNGGIDLVDALMNKSRRSFTVFLGCSGGVRTDLLDLTVPVIDLHDHLLTKFYLCGKTTIAAKWDKNNIGRKRGMRLKVE